MPYDKTLERITYSTYFDELRDVCTVCRVCWNITRHTRKVNYVKIKHIRTGTLSMALPSLEMVACMSLWSLEVAWQASLTSCTHSLTASLCSGEMHPPGTEECGGGEEGEGEGEERGRGGRGASEEENHWRE